MKIEKKKRKVMFVPIPLYVLKGVMIEYWAGRLLLARKLIYRDGKTCAACWFPGNGTIYDIP